MIDARTDEPIRARIEAMGAKLSLPTVRKALGVIEGEHASGRSGGTGELMDVRAYEPGDEARLIEWKTSARQGRPMVVRRERPVTSRVWMLMDVGREMTGSCVSGERAYEVAANALRMFAALSLRRSDDISLVLSDAASITRIPFSGGFARFERLLDEALDRDWSQPRNIDALLAYARRVKDRRALIVLATDEHALGAKRVDVLRAVARTHPIVVIDVATANPFATARSHAVLDGVGVRRLPAFLVNGRAAEEVARHRAYMEASLRRELERVGGHVIRADSSEAMFDAFVRLVSRAVAGSSSGAGMSAPPAAPHSEAGVL